MATSIDYVEVTDAETLVPFDAGTRTGDRALLALALRLGGARLIDNTVLGEDEPPQLGGGGEGGR